MIVFVGIETGQEGPQNSFQNIMTLVRHQMGATESWGKMLTVANTRPSSSSTRHSASRRNSKVHETNA